MHICLIGFRWFRSGLKKYKNCPAEFPPKPVIFFPAVALWITSRGSFRLRGHKQGIKEIAFTLVGRPQHLRSRGRLPLYMEVPLMDNCCCCSVLLESSRCSFKLSCSSESSKLFATVAKQMPPGSSQAEKNTSLLQGSSSDNGSLLLVLVAAILIHNATVSILGHCGEKWFPT